MRGPGTDVLLVAVLASVVTLVLAIPVLRSPATHLFGPEVAGRHHDPFTAMQQFERPLSRSMHQQPVTDVTGALLARVSSPVAAYNGLVLLTFPVSAVAAYLLGRYLDLSRAAAMIAALLFAFSPFHFAHAAYHPHIAQVQWLPLYLLALWRCLDRASVAAVALLVVATGCVTLSNFYGGLIAAVITPAAIASYWGVRSRHLPDARRSLAVTSGALAGIAVGAVAAGTYAGHMAVTNAAALALSPDDLIPHSAVWWSYLIPPVAHPLFGPTVKQAWQAAGVQHGLVEQQLSLGWGWLVLGLVSVHAWLVRGERGRGLWAVPVLASVAVVGVLCSLPPVIAVGPFRMLGLSALLHAVVPMFRAYARFGVIVQLMVALMAALGASYLWHRQTRFSRIAAGALLTLGVLEYAVWPATLWRDVLPTRAHRWAADHPGEMRVLDCVARTSETSSIEWLTGRRITMRPDGFPDCTQPTIAASAGAAGYTHLLVRRRTVESEWYATHYVPDGLRLTTHFDDGDVLAVLAPASPVYTTMMGAFHPRERDRDWTWRWMGPPAHWTVLNPSGLPVTAVLHVELMAFHSARTVEIVVDGVHAQTLTVTPRRRLMPIGPLALTPGRHSLEFRPVAPPTVAAEILHNGDDRPLSLAVGTWYWTTAEPAS